MTYIDQRPETSNEPVSTVHSTVENLMASVKMTCAKGKKKKKI